MKERKKLFYKIGEVCKIAGIQPHVLRYWESEFRMLAPAKNSSGQRIYREKDVQMVLLIKKLLYEDGYTIAGANKRLMAEMGKSHGHDAEQAKGSDTDPARQLLVQMKRELERILTLLGNGDIE